MAAKKKAPKLTSCEARSLLKSRGVKMGVDFYGLNMDAKREILAVADLAKYKLPKNANGSRARYFYERLERAAKACSKR